MKNHFSANNRESVKKELKQGVDVLIVGGGINGAGIARDAAMRGLKVGLLEKNDFASGTSSRSSKLIHGGLRYLEHMDFPLVMESCAERSILLKLAPGLVKPTEFLMPAYKDDRYGLFFMNLGMWLYDFLSLFKNYKFHRKLSAKDVLELIPQINPNGLKGGFIYYDSRVNDARLVINNIVSAFNHGAFPLNYSEAVEFYKQNKRIASVTAIDRLSGEKFNIPCSTFVMAAGPWTNSLYPEIEGEQKALLRLTKGIHLVFPHEKIKTPTAVVILSNNDKRIVFVIPWEEYTIVGTTDTDFNDDINNVYPDISDVSYLIELVNKRFPGISLKPEHAISCYAGLRPLLVAEGSAGEISRRDKIIKTPSGTFIIGGGKLTTYRKISQKAVNLILRELKLSAKPCETGTVPLLKDPPVVDNSGSFRIDKDTAEYLKKRYGDGYLEIIQIVEKNQDMADRIYENLPFIFAEIEYGIKNEMLVHVGDFFRLRTEIFLKSSDNGMSMLDKCSGILGHALGLTDVEIKAQIMDYRQFVNSNLNCIGREWK